MLFRRRVAWQLHFRSNSQYEAGTSNRAAASYIALIISFATISSRQRPQMPPCR
jgi:hypothetical protein